MKRFVTADYLYDWNGFEFLSYMEVKIVFDETTRIVACYHPWFENGQVDNKDVYIDNLYVSTKTETDCYELYFTEDDFSCSDGVYIISKEDYDSLFGNL